MEITQILEELQSFGNPENKVGMSRFGINTVNAYGVSIPVIRKMARHYRGNHPLAIELWKTQVHEARLLATLIDNPKELSEAQMEEWAKDFNSWDICDQACGNLFRKAPFAYKKAIEWSYRSEEFVKRAGFVLMACLAVHDKKADNSQFTGFFAHIEREAKDGRNFVKKALNWALRQIGKRNNYLLYEAIELASRIQEQPCKSARWIAADALRELNKKLAVEHE